MKHHTQCIACGKPISAHEASADDGKIHAQLTLYGPIVRPCVMPGLTMEEACRNLQEAFARVLPSFKQLIGNLEEIKGRFATPLSQRWSYMRRRARRRLPVWRKVR